jgi:hypothetical protein
MSKKIGSQTSICLPFHGDRHSRDQFGSYKLKSAIAHKKRTKKYLTKFWWLTMEEISEKIGVNKNKVAYLFRRKTMDEILEEHGK